MKLKRLTVVLTCASGCLVLSAGQLDDSIYLRLDISHRGVGFSNCSYSGILEDVFLTDLCTDSFSNIMFARNANTLSNGFIIHGTNSTGMFSLPNLREFNIAWVTATSIWKNLHSCAGQYAYGKGWMFWEAYDNYQVFHETCSYGLTNPIVIPVGNNTNCLYDWGYGYDIDSAVFLPFFVADSLTMAFGVPYKPPADSTGYIYIVYDITNHFGKFVLNSVDGTNGCMIVAISAATLCDAGDVNGDGREDLLTGNWILLGRTNKFPFAQATATQVFNGTDGWALALSGDKQTALGDFNGDGLADFAQRDGRTPEWDRRVMVVLGSRTSLQGLSDVDGTNGILLGKVNEFNIENEYFATALAGCGDVNADGYADIIIGNGFQNWATFNYPLRAFVVYGRPVWPGRELVLTSAWFNAVNGFIVQDGPNAYVPGPRSGFGSVLGGKGDFNGDGYDDPLIGAPVSNELYVFFGGESPAWPPGLLMPARVVDSTTGVWQYTAETNALVIGMKATNAAMYAWLNGVRAPQWDAGFGTRYFTNVIAFETNGALTLAYACSNALGWSAHRTLLIITPVPEPVLWCAAWIGYVVLARKRCGTRQKD